MPIDRPDQINLARAFGERHRSGDVVVLPNAFDVATARLIARHDPLAIGTTSGAIAAGLGYPDGEAICADEMVAAIARIAGSVPIGVTADIEAGYGDRPEDAAGTTSRVLDAGVIGVNLQDTGHPDGEWAGGLLPVELAAAKVRATRVVADTLGVPLVLNARTDTFLEDGDPVAGAITRGNAYLAAGADCVFAPGVGAGGAIARLVDGLDGPLNVYAVPGTPSVAELRDLGVRRVSVGCGPYQACLALVARATSELLEHGTYAAFTDEQLSYPDLLELLR